MDGSVKYKPSANDAGAFASANSSAGDITGNNADRRRESATTVIGTADMPQWPVRRDTVGQPRPKELYLDPSLYTNAFPLGLRCVPVRMQDHVGLLGSGKIACAVGSVKTFGIELQSQASNIRQLLAGSTTKRAEASSKQTWGSHRLWHKFHSYSHESLLCVSAACELPAKSSYVTFADVEKLFEDSNPVDPLESTEKQTSFAEIRDFLMQLIEKHSDISAIVFILPLCMPSDVPISLGITLEYAIRDCNFPLAWISNQIGCMPNKVLRGNGRDFVQITPRLCLLNLNGNNSSYLRKNVPFLNNEDSLWHAVELAADEAAKVARQNSSIEENSADEKKIGPRLLVMGGKDAGKSTVVRYCLNFWLTKHWNNIDSKNASAAEKNSAGDALAHATTTSTSLSVAKNICFSLLPQVLDVDLGQSEFQVSGHIILSDITEPVWGSPGCRLSATSPRAQIYLGVASPSNPYPLADEYRTSIERLMQLYHDQTRPLVVNTMGWVQNQGHSFLEHIVGVVKPHAIIDLGDYNEEVRQHVYTADLLKTRPQFTRIHKMRRNLSPNFPWCRMPNPARRELALMARLCEVFDDRPTLNGRMTTISSPDLLRMPAMKLSLSKFAVHCVGGTILPSLLLRALNVSVVAVCRLSETDFVTQTRALNEAPQQAEVSSVQFDEKNPRWLERLPVNATYFGLGIIVGIEHVEKQIYLLTSVPQQVVENDANVLIRSGIDLPRPIADNFEQYRRSGRQGAPMSQPARQPANSDSSSRYSPSKQPDRLQQQSSPILSSNRTNKERPISPQKEKPRNSEADQDAASLCQKLRPYFVPSAASSVVNQLKTTN